MKALTLALLFVSLNALAITEVECTGRNADNERVAFTIELGWGNTLRDARYRVFENATDFEDTYYRVGTMSGQFNRVIYTGTEGVRLEIELAQHREPQWNIRYRGNLSVSYARIGTLSCRFPQVRPRS